MADQIPDSAKTIQSMIGIDAAALVFTAALTAHQGKADLASACLRRFAAVTQEKINGGQ